MTILRKDEKKSEAFHESLSQLEQNINRAAIVYHGVMDALTVYTTENIVSDHHFWVSQGTKKVHGYIYVYGNIT